MSVPPSNSENSYINQSIMSGENEKTDNDTQYQQTGNDNSINNRNYVDNTESTVPAHADSILKIYDDDTYLAFPDSIGSSSTTTTTSYSAVNKPLRKSSRSRSASLLKNSRLLHETETPSPSMKLVNSLNSLNGSNASCGRRSSVDSNASSSSLCSTSSVKYVAASINKLMQHNISSDHINTEINFNISKPILNNIITSHSNLVDLNSEKETFAHEQSLLRSEIASTQSTLTSKNIKYMEDDTPSPNNATTPVATDSNSSLKSVQILQSQSQSQSQQQTQSPPPLLQHSSSVGSTSHSIKQPHAPTRFNSSLSSSSLERSKPGTTMDRGRTSGSSGTTTPGLVFPSSPTPSLRTSSTGSMNQMIKPIYLQQQYVINEKQYLKKIKNTKSSQNDYYTRGIFANTNSSLDVDSFYKDGNLKLNTFLASPDSEGNSNSGLLDSAISPTTMINENPYFDHFTTKLDSSNQDMSNYNSSKLSGNSNDWASNRVSAILQNNDGNHFESLEKISEEQTNNYLDQKNEFEFSQKKKQAHNTTTDPLSLENVDRVQTPVDTFKNQFLNKLKSKNVSQIEADYLRELQRYGVYDKNNSYTDADLADLKSFGRFTKQSFDKKNLQSDNGSIDPSSPTTNFSNLPLHISPDFVTLDDCNIEERLEWQLMLTRVLKGDIVQNEKSKLSELKEQIRGHTKNFKNNIWMELKAWMNGNSVQDQMKSLQVLKNTVADDVIQKILEYQFITDDSGNIAVQECDDLIEQYYKVTTYWKNLKDMYVDKPITATQEFQNVLDLLTSFGNIRNGMRPLFEEVIESTNVYQYCSDFNDVMYPGMYGSDALQYQINSSYVDKFNKEEDIESTFQKRIFSRHAPWIFKATSFAIKHKELFEKMNLQSHTQCVRIMILFPLKLITELIKIKLDYSKNLVDPTMMIIDQIIEDLCVQIKLAAQIKYSVMGSAFFVSDWPGINEFDHVVVGAIQHVFEMINLKIASKSTSIFKTSKDTDELLQHWETFRNMGVFVNEKIGYEVAQNYTKLFLQLTMKLHVFILKRIKKIPEFKKEQDLEKWLIESLEKIGTVKRKFGRFFHNLSGSLINQSNFEIDDFDVAMNSLKESDHVFIYTGGNLESYGVYVVASKELIQNGNFNKQKLLQILNNEAVCSSLTPSMDIKNSLNIYSIDESNHQSEVSIEENLYWKTDPDNKSRYHYVSKNSETPSRKTFAPELFKDDTHDLTNKLSLDSPDYNDDEIDEDELQDTSTGKVETKTKNAGYLLLLKPKSTILWEGAVATLNEPLLMHELKLDIDKLALSISHMCLFTEGSSYNTDSQIEKILGMMGNSVHFLNKVCSLNSINKVLNKINMVYYKMTTSLLICYPEVVLKTDEKFPGCEILNNGFLFCRDFARSYLASSEQWLSEDRKSALILNIMQLSIQWVGFICDKCNPTDLKTFRWCVPAMEYAMKLTSGRNVLTLSDDQYNDLKRKISGCMSLLISHFDIMGGRARAIAENKYLLAAQQKLSGTQILLDEYDDDAVLQVNSQIRMESIKNLEKHYRKKSKQKKKVGKVLNDSDREDKYLATLASSLSNVSIKWRKRQYIGGGSFGDVYSAINLDTGSILAVKQIKIQHSKNMEKIYPRIKDEMNVLEVLNHPNVVQYYGVEVHREKVNIFMEFCEGGSLAALLEHGRFEDEVITQIYSLQLLEGLAYLHHSGVVHRDIKPENILLDHNGVVKYVDFGAAELISKNGTRKYSSTRSRNGKQNSMMGTPMYMAPENITGKRKGNQLGSDDIWSLGCVVLEMSTGRRPWAHLDNEWAIMYHVAAGQIPQFPTSDEMSSSGVRFLSRLLKNNPDQRATAVELLLDPWIVEIRKIAFSADDSSSSSSTPASTPI